VYDCSLQKFKLNLANTVISQENSSLLSMNTSDLLDLFQLSDNPGEMAKGSEKVRVLVAYSSYPEPGYKGYTANILYILLTMACT
jgi:hypothetical protein